MSRTCTVCAHKKRKTIDAALVVGEPIRDISERFKLSRSAVNRHKAGHIPATLALAKAAGEVANADDLLAEARDLRVRTLKALAKAERKGDLRTFFVAVREARGNLELMARLLGQLQERASTVNMLVASPEWIAFRTAAMKALQPYPEARFALAAALTKHEESDVHGE